MVSENFTATPSCPENEERILSCNECNNETRHKVLCTVKTHDSDCDGNVDFYQDYNIVKCGCDTISFEKVSTCSEDYDVDEKGWHLNERKEVYPNRVAGKAELEDSHYLPSNIYRIYTETHLALCNNLLVITGIGIRAIIETVCRDKKITGKDLYKKIEHLCANGFITQDGATILHTLREMGNDAAHEVKAHSLSQLVTAMKVAENLLYTVYILPAQAAKLPAQTTT